MTTIKDIARECGVSANTVSCVLNNKPGEVSERTKKRVLETIRRLGYRPNASARHMVGKRTNTIGIADRYQSENRSDFYKVQLMHPLIQAIRASRRDVLYYSGHFDIGGFTSFLDRRTDGLICISGNIDQDEIAAILRTEVPIVFIGTPLCGSNEQRSASIDVDNEAGAYEATNHLIALGHKRIAMFQGPGMSGNEQRLLAFLRALSEYDLKPIEIPVVQQSSWEQLGYEEAVQVVSMPASQRPTAIFCFNDVLAFTLLLVADELRVRVPDDLSIVGFDDVYPAAITHPALTTVRQPLDWIGQRAVEILIGIIERRLAPDYTEVVEPTFVIRSSTAIPPNGP
jgi:LacI family transcriptional regulator